MTIDVVPPAGLLRTLSRHWGFRVGALLAVMLAALALIGPLLAHGPNVTDYANQLASPGTRHWLGTDSAGRDEFARTVAGARTTLGAAILVFALTTVIGITVGTAAGFLGGIFDACVSRLIDLLLGLPSLVLALAVVGVLGPGFSHLILAMTITGWAGLAKVSRSYTIGARQRPDVTAARMAGIQLYDTVAPWLVIGPGLGIIAAVTAATLISDALRDCTDPSRA